MYKKRYYFKLIIDLIALSGIILYISRISIESGYFLGYTSGLSIVIFSFVIPNLYLHKLIILVLIKIYEINLGIILYYNNVIFF